MIAEGWTYELENGNNFATGTWRRPVFKEAVIEFAGDALTVETEIGSGYGRESTSTTIPLSVLIALLKGAGYTVSATPSERPAQAPDDG